jgi:hypothetical protein
VLYSFRKWFEIFRSAYSSWAAVLGTILATVALCNLTFRVMDVSVFEVLAWILAAYQKTFHSPIDYFLSFFSLRIPTAAKDGLVFYIAMSGILYRTLSYQGASPLKMPGPVTWRMRILDMRAWASKILVALFWPYFLRGLLRHPSFLVRSSLGYHGRMPPPRSDLPPAKRKEVMDTMLSYLGKDATVICNERQLLGIYAMALFAAVLGLVIVNAAVDRLSGAY